MFISYNTYVYLNNTLVYERFAIKGLEMLLIAES